MLRKTSPVIALALVGFAIGCSGRVGDVPDPQEPGPNNNNTTKPQVCQTGYERIDDTCQDIDECQASPCDANATCTNQLGSFECACNDGFQGNGTTCSAVANRCDDFTAVLADNGCVTCHDSTPGVEGGDLDLLSPGVGERLVARPSGNSSCNNQLLIDPANPGDSMVLKLIDPERHAAWTNKCIGMMPFGRMGVPAADVTCFEQWVQEVADNYTPPPPPPPPPPFDAMPAESVLSKAKYILHGGAVTAAEIEGVTTDDGTLSRAGLRRVIESWRSTPEFQRKIESFLKLSLQQQEINPRTTNRGQAYRDQFDPINNNNGNFVIDRTTFLQSLDEIFVRTAWQIVATGGDFRQVATTRRWQVTTAILAALVYADRARNPGDRFKLLAHLQDSDYSDWRAVNFTQASAASEVPQFQNTAAFVANLRGIANGGSLPLRAPRVGFFNTPTFFESWETNDDNQFRVTTNQAILGALDILFEAGDTTNQANENGLATEHAQPDTACYQCHRLLDPMRLQFRNVYNFRYRMLDQPEAELAPSFAFQGFTATPLSMDDFGQALVSHPRFPTAWVQKLCMWANAQRCVETDPEFTRLVNHFVASDYDLMDLVLEVFTSPLVTNAAATATHETNEFFVSAARSNHMCSALQTRIRSARTERCAAEQAANPDANPAVCNQRNNMGCNAINQTRAMAQLISEDGYGRGSREFIQESQSGPFNSRALLEICTVIATREVGGGNQTFTPADVNGSIDRMVRHVMGLPNTHPRFAAARDALRRAYDIGRATPRCSENGGDVVDDNATDITCGFALSAVRALYISWILACSSPELAGLGI